MASMENPQTGLVPATLAESMDGDSLAGLVSFHSLHILALDCVSLFFLVWSTSQLGVDVSVAYCPSVLRSTQVPHYNFYIS